MIDKSREQYIMLTFPKLLHYLTSNAKFQLGFFSEHQTAAEWRMTLKFIVISVIVSMQSLTCAHADQHTLHGLLAEIKTCSVSCTASS